ncbi:insertion element protein [Candidatus Magnetoovum chiemensis]|nr:insertion element protein [Candidatus Magnetoovum chiemensis]
MYTEGMTISAIGRVLSVKLGMVFDWIKKTQKALQIMNKKVEQLRNNGSRTPQEISLDEMWTYVGARTGDKRNSVWIWTAVFYDKVIFEVGKRDEKTFLNLYDKLPEAKKYYSDGYEVYKSWLPEEKHRGKKSGKTNRNEGIHSFLRDKLSRLRRKTKAYSKSIDMLTNSIVLVILTYGLL